MMIETAPHRTWVQSSLLKTRDYRVGIFCFFIFFYFVTINISGYMPCPALTCTFNHPDYIRRKDINYDIPHCEAFSTPFWAQIFALRNRLSLCDKRSGTIGKLTRVNKRNRGNFLRRRCTSHTTLIL